MTVAPLVIACGALASELRAVLKAQGLADRLRIGIEQMKFQDLPAVTISVGVAEWDPAESSAELSITRADGRMYEAKRGGGNRVA